MSRRPRVRLTARAARILMTLAAGAAMAADGASDPGPAPEAAPAAVTAPGRSVVLDARVMLADRKRELSLSDLDPEQAAIVREINRRPGTWQFYLLYTAEDLPERMFHPGFAIRLPPRPRPVTPPPAEAGADADRADEAPRADAPSR